MKGKRIAAMVLAAVMCLGTMPAYAAQTEESNDTESDSLNNPRVIEDDSMAAGQSTTWDCVWFGSYPQTEIVDQPETSGRYLTHNEEVAEYTTVDNCAYDEYGNEVYEVDPELYARLQNASYDEYGDTVIDGTKYRREAYSNRTVYGRGYYWFEDRSQYYYFRYDPIKWRVLKTDGEDAYLLADEILDNYEVCSSEKDYYSVTWADSSIRSFLNGYSDQSRDGIDYSDNNFIDRAFNAEEQAAIQTAVLNNSYISDYRTHFYYGFSQESIDTADKVFLLSESEVTNEGSADVYGFKTGYLSEISGKWMTGADEAKACGYSSFAGAVGASQEWVLRNNDMRSIVQYNGGIYFFLEEGEEIVSMDRGIRPALFLDLTDTSVYSYAGTVCSKDFAEETTDDDDETDDEADSYSNENDLVVSVLCPVDVEVFDADGQSLAQTQYGDLSYCNGEGLKVTVNGDEKIIAFPKDSNYSVKTCGYADGTMDFTCTLTDDNGNAEKIYDFTDLPVAEGKTVLNMTTSFDGAEVTVSFTDGQDQAVEADRVLTADEIESYQVILESEQEGVIFKGSGTYQFRDYVWVYSYYDSDDAYFVGWYDSEGNLVSNDVTIGFSVDQDVELIAKYETVSSGKEYTVNRYSGDTRYDTAIQSADALKDVLCVDNFENIVIASGVNFPDALAGSPLASQLNAPILLVGSNDANKGQAEGTAKTIEYIKNNLVDGGTVYILGGTSAVSEQTEETLQEAGFATKRLAGNDRYETNLEIINQMSLYQGMEVVIVRGYTSYKTAADKAKKQNPQGYADSLSVSGVAGYYGMPIFLVGEKGLSEAQMELLSSLEPSYIYVIGGTSAVSDATYQQIDEGTTGEMMRIAGDNRYETSVAIAERFGMDYADAAVVAYGQNYPDGLTGGVLAAKLGAPLLLAEKGKISVQKEFLDYSTITQLDILGGTTVLPEETIEEMIK